MPEANGPVARLPLGIIVLCLAIIAVVWAALAYDLDRSEKGAIRQAANDTRNLAIAFRENVERTVSAIDQLMLTIIAENSASGDLYHIPPWVGRSPLLRGMSVQVSMAGPDGIMRASDLGISGRIDLSDRPHFRYHLDPSAPEPYISVPVIGRNSGKWSIQITRRIPRADGSFGGVMVVSIDPFYFSSFFETVNLGSKGAVDLVGQDGIVRARRARDSQEIGQDVSGTALFRHVQSQASGNEVVHSRIDGTERVFGYAAVPDYPLYVVVGLAVDDVRAPLRAKRVRYLAVGCVLTLIIVTMGWFLARETKRRRERELAAHAEEKTREQKVLLEKALENARRNREFLDRVIENVPVTILVKDARTLTYVLVNKAAEKLWGLPREALLGKTAREIFDRGTADAVEADDRKLLQSPSNLYSPEHKVTTPRNGVRLVTGNRIPIQDQDGEVQYLLGVIEDVTERKSVEEQLRQAQKMEAIGNLTGGVAHDFNNLLTIILGNLDLLQEELAGNHSAEEKIRTILEAAERGTDLTGHMLTFSRRRPLQAKEVDVNGLIVTTKRLLARTLGENISIVVHPAAENLIALVDPSQLGTAILNIAINARDAMPGGGTLTISSRAVELDEADVASRPGLAAGAYAVIEIADTGTGMPPELIDRIFEPFFTTKPVGKGTGLGLSMVYGFLKQSGGDIRAYSEVGRGTVFKLFLPLRRPAAQSAASLPRKPLAAPATGQEVILAVEDNPDIRATVVRQLRDLGYQVREADCAESALRILDAAEPIDLLFTDMIMPGGINGKELATRARGKRADLKVLFTSGFPGTSTAHGTQLEPGDVLLSKPYHKHDLARAVAEVLTAPAA